MPQPREGLASVSLGNTKAIALKLMRDARYANLSEACRAGLRRVEEDNRIIDQLVARGEVGAESGVDFEFDIDDFVTEMVTEK